MKQIMVTRKYTRIFCFRLEVILESLICSFLLFVLLLLKYSQIKKEIADKVLVKHCVFLFYCYK